MTSSVARKQITGKKKKSASVDWEPRMCPHSRKNVDAEMPENGKMCDKDVIFTRQFQFNQHVARTHLKPENRPFQCQVTDCTAPIKGFASKNDLKRHMGSAHGEGEIYPCPDEECPYEATTRPDNLKDHLERTHEISVTHKDVRTRKVTYDGNYFYLKNNDEDDTPRLLSNDGMFEEEKECLLCPKTGEDFVQVTKKEQTKHFTEQHLGREMSSEIEDNILGAIKEDREINHLSVSISDKQYLFEGSVLLEKLLNSCPRLENGNRAIMKSSQGAWHKYMNHDINPENENTSGQRQMMPDRIVETPELDENLSHANVNIPVNYDLHTDDEQGHENETKIRCDVCSQEKNKDVMIGRTMTLQHYERKHRN